MLKEHIPESIRILHIEPTVFFDRDSEALRQQVRLTVGNSRNGGSLPTSASFCQIDTANFIVLAFKQAADSRGHILRLLEMAAKVSLPSTSDRSARAPLQIDPTSYPRYIFTSQKPYNADRGRLSPRLLYLAFQRGLARKFFVCAKSASP